MSTTDGQKARGTDEDYVARFCEHDGRIVECTIFPRGLDESQLVTTWVSASPGSFVDLTSIR